MSDTVAMVWRRHNREKAVEAAVALGTGVASLIGIYALVFWLTWVGAWFTRALHELDPATVALIATGGFFVVALVSAPRSITPLDHIQLALAPGEEFVRDTGGSPASRSFGATH